MFSPIITYQLSQLVLDTARCQFLLFKVFLLKEKHKIYKMNMEEFDLMMKLMELIKIKNEIASERRKAGLAGPSPSPSRPRSIYTCQPGRVVQCNFKEKHKANAYPRTCQRIVVTNSHLYVVGGYNALNHVPPYNMFRNFQELWSFNLATKRWKQELDSDNVFFPESFFISAIVPYNSMLLVSILEGEGRKRYFCRYLRNETILNIYSTCSYSAVL